MLSGVTEDPSSLSLNSSQEIAPGVVIINSSTMLDEGSAINETAGTTTEIIEGDEHLGGNGLQFNLVPAVGMSQQAIDGFQAAANLWSTILSDDILVNIDIDFRDLGQDINGNDILGSTSSTKTTSTYTAFRNGLVSDVKTLNDAAATTNLESAAAPAMWLNRTSTNPNGSGSATPYLDNDGDANNSTIRLSTANAKAVGLLAANAAGSDGSIAFSNQYAFDFDRSDGITTNTIDFIGVAAHEIGHLLGFFSGVDILDGNSPPNGGPFADNAFTYVSPLDLFRYSADSFAQGAGVNDWTADSRSKYFSIDGGATQLTTFATGLTFGDGDQASHWKDGLGIGLMDPAVSFNEYSDITDLDVQAFDVMGWDVAMDYGDAPDTAAGTSSGNYRTNLSDDGPRHYLFDASGSINDQAGAPKVYLGSGVTRDFNGKPNAGATGDTDNGIASFPTLTTGTTANFTVTSSGGGATLNYFFDFNADGDFLDANESASAILNSTSQSVSVSIPSNAVAGSTLARFRISSAGGLGSTGAAADGEVEDYLVTLTQTTPGITVTQSGGDTIVSEHGVGVGVQKTDTFDVVLNAAPTSNVVLNVTTTDSGEITVSTPTLTFTPGNWNIAQTVTVSGVFDNIADGTQFANVILAVNDALSDDAYDPVAHSFFTATINDVANRPAVTGPTGENISPFPTFSWTAVTGATNIALYLINKGTGALVLAKEDIAGNATSYMLTNGDLAGGLPLGDYRFWINSISTNGYSQSGAPTDFAVGTAAVVPASPTVTGTSGTANQPQINWTAGSGSPTYNVYFINRGTNTVVASQSGIVGNSFTPAAPLADGKYRIWVSATNVAGTSAWSTPFDFDVGTPVVVPSTPTVTGTSGLANQPTINWSAGSGSPTYGVYLINLDTNTLVTSQTGIGTNSFTPAAALADGRYRIWVNATNIAGSSAWSPPFDFSIGTAPTMPPTTPTGFVASNTNTTTPTVTWTGQAAGTKYEIWFVNLDTGTLVASQTNLTTASFTPASPLANGHYRLFVRAFNSIGSSGWSVPFDFTVTA